MLIVGVMLNENMAVAYKRDLAGIRPHAPTRNCPLRYH